MDTPQGSSKLGALLRAERERAGLTQTDLARITGVKREYIGSIELGRMQVVYPEAFNKLHRALRFPAFEWLEAMGFETDSSEQGILPALAVLLKSMTAEEQKAFVDLAKSILKAKGASSDRELTPCA